MPWSTSDGEVPPRLGDGRPGFTRRMEDAGAAAVAVRGAFAEQLATTAAPVGRDLPRGKEAVSVAVIGNGDVKRGCDAAAVVEAHGLRCRDDRPRGRGTPGCSRRRRAARLPAGRAEPAMPGVGERIAMARRHARLLSEREGKNIVRMRKHRHGLAGLPGAASAREDAACVTVEDFDRVFDELLEKGPSCLMIRIARWPPAPAVLRESGARYYGSPRQRCRQMRRREIDAYVWTTG